MEKTIIQHLLKILESNKLNLREKSYQSYHSKIKNFSNWLNGKGLEKLPLQDFTYELAQDFLNQFDRHIKTRHSNRQILIQYFGILQKKGLIEKNPFQGTTLPKKKTTEEKRHFNEQERKILKEHLSIYYPELWMFVQFMYYTLIRPKELRLLKVSDIHENTILVRAENAKNGLNQFITIPEVFAPTIRAYIEKMPKHYYLFGNTKPKGINHFNRIHDKVLAFLKIKEKNVSLYSWKHTGAVCFYNATKDIYSLKEQMRHSSLEMTERYLKSRNIKENKQAKESYPTL